jgi:hypothetical protein
MPITTVHCPASHSDVVRITDFEGATTRVLCAEYDEASDTCRLKMRAFADAPLARLLERADERTLATHDVRCVYA